MAKHVYWTGSIDPVWHGGLQRFLSRGDAADADDVGDDDRWVKTRPHDAAPGEEQPTAAEDAAPQEVKDRG